MSDDKPVLNNEHPCTLENVEVLRSQSARFTVTAEGEDDDYIDDCDLGDIEEYYCDNCDGCWVVGAGYRNCAAAWQAVCEHLNMSEAAA